MNRIALALVVTFWVGVLPAAATGKSAAEIAADFCATRTAHDDEKLKLLLTPSLLKVVVETEQRNDVIAKAQPDEKPPFGDGIPYQSFPDTPSECKPGAPVDRAGRTDVSISYIFPGSAEADWTDTLELVTGTDGALIDDIRYQGAADSSGEVTMREILHDAFDQ